VVQQHCRKSIPGYKLDGERLEKIPLPSPPPAAIAKKKKKKKRKRSSSDSSDEDAPGPSNRVPEVQPPQEEKKEKKKKKKKRQKKPEDEASPPIRVTSTPAAATTTRDTSTLPTNNKAQNTTTTTGGGNEDLAWRASLKRTDIKSGAYSATEQETIRNAVIAFAQARNLSTEDFSWIFAGKGQRSSDIRGLWKQVAVALPNRTIKSVAAAGNRLFHPDAKKGKWTSEEDEELRAAVSDLGNKWLQIGARLGRPREACRVRYREIQLGGEKKTGRWSTEEEEKLKEAVNEYLEAKKEAERTTTGNVVSMPTSGTDGGAAGPSSSRGATTPIQRNLTSTRTTTPSSQQKLDKRVVLDDIDWGIISQKVQTRSNLQCLEKWYDQMAPSMVDRGDWGTGDDRRLLKALWRAGDISEFEVQWDGLVPERTAQQARRRWRLMVKVVPNYKDKEFSQVVKYLVEKHLPQLMVKEPRNGTT
jgi:hypothetical protein